MTKIGWKRRRTSARPRELPRNNRIGLGSALILLVTAVNAFEISEGPIVTGIIRDSGFTAGETSELHTDLEKARDAA